MLNVANLTESDLVLWPSISAELNVCFYIIKVRTVSHTQFHKKPVQSNMSACFLFFEEFTLLCFLRASFYCLQTVARRTKGPLEVQRDRCAVIWS